MVANNTRRNSTNINIPTVTIVDSVEPIDNDRKSARNCCGCIPDRVGVFAILSVYFFLGTFYSLASFVGLGLTSDPATIALYCITGVLNALVAIISALSADSIRKEKVVMMRRLSIVFWIITALMLIFSVAVYILQVVFRSSTVQACQSTVVETYGESGNDFVKCDRVVDDSLASEAIRLFVIGTISIYFAYVIFRYAKQMKEPQDLDILPMSVDGQKTPTYFVYSTQPPTSNNWVPPPTYTVRATNPLPDDFNPDSKQTSN